MNPWVCSNEKVKETLGWQPRHDLESGLAETVRWKDGIVAKLNGGAASQAPSPSAMPVQAEVRPEPKIDRSLYEAPTLAAALREGLAAGAAGVALLVAAGRGLVETARYIASAWIETSAVHADAPARWLRLPCHCARCSHT